MARAKMVAMQTCTSRGLSKPSKRGSNDIRHSQSRVWHLQVVLNINLVIIMIIIQVIFCAGTPESPNRNGRRLDLSGILPLYPLQQGQHL